MLEYLIKMLKNHEGYRSKVYLCSAGKRTIGYGHNLDSRSYYIDTFGENVTIPNKINRKTAEDILIYDISLCVEDVERLHINFNSLCDVRQSVIIDMLFNLGLHRLSGFKKFLYYLRVKDFSNASIEMMDSRWAIQVKSRAEELRDMMKSGEYK